MELADNPTELVPSSTVAGNQKLVETDEEYLRTCLGQAEDITNEQMAGAPEFF